MQASPEFIMQGKHFAHSVGKNIFSDEEVTSLDTLYGRTSKPQSLGDFLSKVCAMRMPPRRVDHRMTRESTWYALCSRCSKTGRLRKYLVRAPCGCASCMTMQTREDPKSWQTSLALPTSAKEK